MSPSEKEMLTVDEYCAVYSRSRRAAYRDMRDGLLKAVKVGSRTLIRKRDADEWAASLPAMSTAAA